MNDSPSRILGFILAFFIGILVFSCTKKAVPLTHVDFKTVKTFAEARAESQRQNKPIFVDVYATWCGPCKFMDKNVFTDKSVYEPLNTHFISVKLDGESLEGINFTMEYPINGYPSYFFFDKNGRILQHIEGMRMAETFAQDVRKAMNN